MRRLPAVAATTLVELLVVIVVLLIGILAVLQVFPAGLGILALNRNAVVANALAKGEAQRVVGRSDQLAEEIRAVTYRWDSTATPPGVKVDDDPNRQPNDLGLIPGATIDNAGNVLDAGGHTLGIWPYLSGPNLFRRIVGEGGRVPAPRQVGDYYGGLMVLQFTPIVYNAADPGLFQIYGADMVRIEGPVQAGEQPQRFEYHAVNIDQPNATLVLPQDPVQQRTYRLALSCYVTNGGVTQKRDYVDKTIVVPSGAGQFYPVALGDNSPTNPPNILGLAPSDTFEGAELESVRVARLYEPLNVSDSFSDPYQYKLLDANMGVILFSDQAFNAYELKDGRRVPLQARVNYDVLDWRIMRDEFRIPDDPVPQVKLALGNLKVKGTRDVDNTVFQGLNPLLANGAGFTNRRDLALMDVQTGGIILEQSATRTVNGAPKQLFRIDKSVGLLTFFDADDNPNNGITGEIVYPGNTANLAVDINLSGRPVRAMYEARNEYATQVMKAPALFSLSQGVPSSAQYYVGGSNPAIGGSATRIYFPQTDTGQRITVDQIWYRDATSTTALSMTDQSFIVQSQPADPTGLAYVDIKAANPDATGFDTTTYGYGVDGVKGASVTVRVLWNPSRLDFVDDQPTNLRNLEIWQRDWRQVVAETYVQRSGQ